MSMSKNNNTNPKPKLFNIDAEANKHYPKSLPVFKLGHSVPVFHAVKHYTLGGRFKTFKP